MIRQIEWCIEQAESDEGIQIATMLIDLSNDIFQGDEELIEKFW
ncbi:hypothetical protein [Gracilibacillus salinarum]|nr:hypothetical protein [Gracilibacillus salinarum]